MTQTEQKKQSSNSVGYVAEPDPEVDGKLYGDRNRQKGAEKEQSQELKRLHSSNARMAASWLKQKPLRGAAKLFMPFGLAKC